MSGWLFDAVPNYARSANPVTAYPWSAMVCAYTNEAGVASFDVLFQMSQAGSTSNHWSLRRTTAGSTMEFWTVQGGNTGIAVSTTPIVDNVPFVAVIVATSATSRRIIVDGDIAGAATNTDSVTPLLIDRLSFGQKDDTAAQTNGWEGVVFSGALWTAALTDDEAVALAGRAWPASIRPGSLRNFWPNFTDQGGGVIPDWCGRSPLTLSGGSASSATARRLGPPVSQGSRVFQGTLATARVI